MKYCTECVWWYKDSDVQRNCCGHPRNRVRNGSVERRPPPKWGPAGRVPLPRYIEGHARGTMKIEDGIVMELVEDFNLKHWSHLQRDWYPFSSIFRFWCGPGGRWWQPRGSDGLEEHA